tara:strand:+ start:595 stop:711 length:117 start_codon:yes stop_codon:yes gene_type:complete
MKKLLDDGILTQDIFEKLNFFKLTLLEKRLIAIKINYY